MSLADQQAADQQQAAARDTPARPRLVQELHDRLDELDIRVGEFVGTLTDELDEAFGDVWQTLQLLHLIQGGMMQALKALTEDPGSPHSGAAKAREFITDMEEAYGDPAEGSEDDGVVPDSTGDQTGDS